jgi:hypothetical protein
MIIGGNCRRDENNNQLRTVGAGRRHWVLQKCMCVKESARTLVDTINKRVGHRI